MAKACGICGEKADYLVALTPLSVLRIFTGR